MAGTTIRWCVGLVVIGIAALVPPVSAQAEGGTSIAMAPTVIYGQQQTGNTATGGLHADCCGGGTFYSFWGLPVLAGDEVTIDWESVARDTRLKLMPVGTTDFTFGQSEEAAYDYLKANNKSQLRYRASVSGTLPMAFEIADYKGPGPYAFTASVRHVVFTGLTPITSINRTSMIGGSATLADGTPAPDGLVFNLVAKWHNRNGLARAATSTAAAGGSLAFQLKLPPETAGKLVRLAITRGDDGGYQATKSAPVNVRVARLKPKPLKCRKGFKKKKVNGKVRCVRKANRRQR